MEGEARRPIPNNFLVNRPYTFSKERLLGKCLFKMERKVEAIQVMFCSGVGVWSIAKTNGCATVVKLTLANIAWFGIICSSKFSCGVVP